MTKVTMQTVAELAGVTRTTVSRVLHAPHLVALDTRTHVENIVRQCGYVYHAAAANLTRGKMSTIGLVLPTIRSSAFANTILTVQEAAQNLNMTVVLGNTNYDPAVEAHLLQQFQEHRLAGVVMVGFCPGNEQHLFSLSKVGIPVVVIWENLDIPGLSFMGFNNKQATEDMTNHLIGLGHVRIGLMLGPLVTTHRIRQRLEGYKAALESHNLPYDASLVSFSLPTLQEGLAGMRRLMQLRGRPTAVFAASDVLAIGALTAARRIGLRVPEDVAVVGFDGIEFGAHTSPELTTVAVPERQMTWLATRSIAQSIASGKIIPRSRCLKTRIIVRQSCGGQHA